MIQLNDSLFLGSGYHKAAYRHPNEETLCIKVMINEAADAKKQLQRELKHHLNLQRKHGFSIPCLSQYHGEIETDLGIGYLFELVRDYDGGVAKSLEDYLKDPNFVAQHKAQIKTDLAVLKQNLLDYSIIPMDIYPWNIFYRKRNETEFECVLIDDIGTASFIPMEYYSKYFADKRIERRWSNFINGLDGSFL